MLGKLASELCLWLDVPSSPLILVLGGANVSSDSKLEATGAIEV